MGRGDAGARGGDEAVRGYPTRARASGGRRCVDTGEFPQYQLAVARASGGPILTGYVASEITLPHARGQWASYPS